MDDNVVWCALILAVAYVSRHMLPSYYEITSVRRHSLDNMRDDILALDESVEILIKRVDAINNQVDDDEQDLMGALKKIEELQSDVAGHLTRLDDMDETLAHHNVRLATLEGWMWKATTAAPANEVRHD